MTTVSLTLTRSETDDEGTFGTLKAGDDQLCATGELPWRNNEPFKSCIPAGKYWLSNYVSKKFGPCCLLQGTAPRYGILIHKGNWCGDADKDLKCEVEGCIIVGEFRGVLSAQKAVVSSKKAFDKLMVDLWGNGNAPKILTVEWKDGINPE